MDGIFNVNKAANMTSHDVVARVRRLVQQKRVGHAGTLDPAATGVLPICLGQATRVAEYLSESGKAYRATIRFGCETDTYDADGRILREAPVMLEEEDIRTALRTFLGPKLQVPPLYSAIKRAGQPLYKLARAGGEVAPPPPRMVTIYSLDIVSYQVPDLVLDIDCSKGTYIRSLAFDLGRNLGPGAHLASLIRTRSGPFTLSQSIHLEELDQALADGSWEHYLYAPDEALLDFEAAIVGERNEWRLRHGLDLVFPQMARHNSGDLLRTYAVDGRFLGILRWEEEQSHWQPHKVLTG